MPKLHGITPHPAFDTSLLPHHKSTTKATPDDVHYKREYLEDLSALKETIDGAHDVAGWAMTWIVGVFGSMAVALLRPMWVVDSEPFNLFGFIDHPRETIYLRRVLLMATVLASHGLGCASAAHLRGLFFGSDQTDMVQSKIGEWQSHRAHQQSFIQAFKPAFFTRFLLILLQGFSFVMSFLGYLAWPPLVLGIDKWMSSYATQVHTDALTAMAKGEMPTMAAATAPPMAQWFWGLPSSAPFRDVLLAVRADDTWHATFNTICCEVRARPTAAMGVLMEAKGEKHQ